MESEELVMVAFIDVLQVEQVVFQRGEINISSLPLSNYLLFIFLNQVGKYPFVFLPFYHRQIYIEHISKQKTAKGLPHIKSTNKYLISKDAQKMFLSMGQYQSNPFRQGSDLMNDFQVKQKSFELFLTYLKKKSNNKQYLLRQFAFNELREFSFQLQVLKKRKLISHLNLTNLQIVEERAQDQLCSSFYKIYTLWEYPRNSLMEEIALRTLQSKPFSTQQMWNLLQGTVAPLALLQQKGIGHECLTSKAILLQEDGNIKVADPLSIGLTSNMEYVLSNRYNKCIYLSPEQSESISNQRPITNKNSYKNDVFTLALVLLQAGLLEKQDKCFLQDYSVINYSLLFKNIGRFRNRYGPELAEIIIVMTDKNIETRPDWRTLLQKLPNIKNSKATKVVDTARQNIESIPINQYNASLLTRQQPPTIVMPPEPDFKRLFQGAPQLSVIPSVSNEGSSTIRQERRSQPQMYSNISSIPQFSYVSPISASNNTSNFNQYQLQKSLKLKSNINASPSLISHSNFHTSLSNPPVHPSSLNVRFVSQPQNVHIPQKDMSATFGGRNHQEKFVPQNQLIREVSPNKIPLHPRQQSLNIGNELVEVEQQFSKGSCYKGFKLNGARHGQGTFYYQDGGRYEGEWLANKMNGFGRLYYQSDKIAYEGQWLNDQFHGRGILYNQNPVRMNTGFDYRNFDEIDEYWEYYEGHFASDLKNGSGKLKFSNGQVFEGSFVDDMVQGQGVFLCKDGQRIHGVWKENQLVQLLK